MCRSIPCAGCATCYQELRTVAAGDPRSTGPHIDPATPQFGPYVVEYTGRNQQVCSFVQGSDPAEESKGNYYENRRYGSDYPNSRTYYYENLNGSRYWYNPDGSKLFDNGRGFRRLTEATAPLTPPPSPPPRRHQAINVQFDDEGLPHFRGVYTPRGNDSIVMKFDSSDDDEPMQPARLTNVRRPVPVSPLSKGKGRALSPAPSESIHEPLASGSGSGAQTEMHARGFAGYQAFHLHAAQRATSGNRAAATSSRVRNVQTQTAPAQKATRDIGVGDDLDLLTERLNTAVRLSANASMDVQPDVSNPPPIKLTGTVRNVREMGGGSISRNSSTVQRKRVKKVSIIPRSEEHTYHQPPPASTTGTDLDRHIIANSRTRRTRGPEFPLQDKVAEWYHGVADWIKENPNSDVRLGNGTINRSIEQSSTLDLGDRRMKISLGTQLKVEQMN